MLFLVYQKIAIIGNAFVFRYLMFALMFAIAIANHFIPQIMDIDNV